MEGMDARESLRDISKRCGLDIEIVRRVQNAETEHIIDELKKGKKVRIPGRGTYRPELKNTLGLNGTLKQQIAVKFNISDTIKNSLIECDSFINDETAENDIPEGIRIVQISSLQ